MKVIEEETTLSTIQQSDSLMKTNDDITYYRNDSLMKVIEKETLPTIDEAIA
jgi:hypothetical protein